MFNRKQEEYLVELGQQTPQTTKDSYITISTLGNSADFGDLTTSNSEIHLLILLEELLVVVELQQLMIIDYITIATLGNA